MTTVFADTYFYVALLNRNDTYHTAAMNWAAVQRPTIATTEFVLLEVANFFRRPADRPRFIAFVDGLRNDPDTSVAPCESNWFQKGLDRFASHRDKEWSLTDCISFAVMEESGLTDALTHDHHFEQAGFKTLL